MSEILSIDYKDWFINQKRIPDKESSEYKQFFNFPFEQNIKNEDDTKLADSIRPSLQYQKFLASDISLSVILYLFLNI